MKIISTYLLPIILLILGSPIYAESTEEKELSWAYGDEDFVSIATGSQQPIAKAPAVASVITAEDIRAIGATDLNEALEIVPGLHVAKDLQGYNPIFTIRGIYSRSNPQVLMLINGIPITNLFFGDRNQVWGGMPVEAIERIEVMRGPGSAVYGADAIAGVINIITKTRQDIEGPKIGVRAGSFDTLDVWGEYANTWNGIDVAAVFEFRDTDGQSERIDADAQSALDSIFATSASLAPGSVNLARENVDARLDVARGEWRFRAGLQRRRNVGNGAGVAQALDPNNQYQSDRWNADLTYHNPNFTENLDVTAQLSYLDVSQEVQRNLILFPPGANLGFGVFPDGVIGNPEVWERHGRFDLSAFFTGFERHIVRAGLGYSVDDIYKVRETKNFGIDPATGLPLPPGSPLVDVTDTPFVFLREGDRKNYNIFVQDVWSFANDWELTAGVRYDDYSDFGSTLNPRLALVWSARQNLTAKLLYGEAFRAPAFAETRAINNPVTLGNPNLDPEEIDSVELAFDYRPSDVLRLGLNLFRYRWDNIILFVPDPGASTRTAQNVGEQTGHGLEFEAEWVVNSNITIQGNYAYQESTDEDTNKDAGNAPQQQLYVRADWEFLQNWHVNSQANWVLGRKRVDGDNRDDIDDYTIVDLTIRHRAMKDSWEFAVGIRNLFNTNAREPSPAGVPTAAIPKDLPLAGRNYYAEARFNFDAR